MSAIALVLGMAGVLIASTPPLTDEQVLRLAGAVDGADYHDEAFLALVENARQWTQGLGDAPIRLNPDFDVLQNDPANHRGDLCRVVGVLHQATILSPPYEDVTEWFVRDNHDRAVIVYVVGADQSAPFRDFDRAEIDARFYKRMELIARDGTRRTYPALVGALPRMASADAGRSPVSTGSIVAGLVALLAIVFIGLMMWARKSGGGRREMMRVQVHRARTSNPTEAVDDVAALPDDPAVALSELKRRAEIESHANEG